jgi:predicted nucleotidyltransferase
MNRDEVQRRLSENRQELAALGVRDLYLFGSVARGEARVDSDVDLLVEFDRAVGLLQFFRVQQRLSELLGRPVDLVMKEAIKPQLRARILAEAVRAA